MNAQAIKHLQAAYPAGNGLEAGFIIGAILQAAYPAGNYTRAGVPVRGLLQAAYPAGNPVKTTKTQIKTST